MTRKREETNSSGLLDGFGSVVAARVRAEQRVLEFLLGVQSKMDGAGVGTRQLARVLGSAPGQVSRWLKAETGINARTMFLLADALGYELEFTWKRKSDAPVLGEGTVQTLAEVVHLPVRTIQRVYIEGPGFDGADHPAA